MSDSPIVALSQFRADLSRSLSRRGKRLLEAADLPEQVASLEPLELYLVVKELGVDAAVPILMAASPRQLQTCIDLDGWSDDRPDPVELDAWLAPFAAEGPETLAHAFLSLDLEIQVAFIARSVSIYDPKTEMVPEPRQEVPRATTDDSLFVVEPAGAEEREVDPIFLVKALYRADLQEGYRLLMAAKWELLSLLEEEAYRFRKGRLEDLGFIPPEEAARLFATPATRTDAVPGPPTPRLPTTELATLPALYAAQLADETPLGRALSQIADPHVLDRMEHELVCLINMAVVGYGGSPQDLRYVGEVAGRVRDTLSLGLQVLLRAQSPELCAGSAPADERAGTLVQSYPLIELFRHGYAEVFALRKTCMAVVERPGVAGWLNRPDTEQSDDLGDRLDRFFVASLLLPRPLHGGFDPAQPQRRKAFATLEELERCGRRLEDLRAQLES